MAMTGTPWRHPDQYRTLVRPRCTWHGLGFASGRPCIHGLLPENEFLKLVSG